MPRFQAELLNFLIRYGNTGAASKELMNGLDFVMMQLQKLADRLFHPSAVALLVQPPRKRASASGDPPHLGCSASVWKARLGQPLADALELRRVLARWPGARAPQVLRVDRQHIAPRLAGLVDPAQVAERRRQ